MSLHGGFCPNVYLFIFYLNRLFSDSTGSFVTNCRFSPIIVADLLGLAYSPSGPSSMPLYLLLYLVSARDSSSMYERACLQREKLSMSTSAPRHVTQLNFAPCPLGSSSLLYLSFFLVGETTEIYCRPRGIKIPSIHPLHVATSSLNGRTHPRTDLPEHTNRPTRLTDLPIYLPVLVLRLSWPRLFVKLALLRCFRDAASTAPVHFSPLLPGKDSLVTTDLGVSTSFWLRLFPTFILFWHFFVWIYSPRREKDSCTNGAAPPTKQCLPQCQFWPLHAL